MTLNRKKMLSFILLLLLFFFVISAIIAPKLIDLNQHKDLIISKLEPNLQGEVHLGSIKWGITNGLWIEIQDFSIKDTALFPADLILPKIFTRISIFQLLFKKLDIKELELEAPEITLKQKSGIKNDTPLSDESPLPIEILIGKLFIKKGQLKIESGENLPLNNLKHRFNNINLQATFEGVIGNRFSISGSVDLSELTYQNSQLWDPPVTGAEASVSLRIDIDPDNITIDNFEISKGKFHLKSRAHVNSWKTDPVIQDINISSHLDLKELDEPIILKTLDDPTGMTHQIIKKGGLIELDSLSLSELDLKTLFTNPSKLLHDIELKARLFNIVIPLSPDLPELECLSGNFLLNQGVASLNNLKVRTALTELPEISARMTRLLDEPVLEARIQGNFIVPEEKDPYGVRFLRSIGIENLSGTADIDLSLKLLTSQPEKFQLQGITELKSFNLKTIFSPVSLTNINTIMKINPTTVELPDLSATVIIPGTKISQEGRFSLHINGELLNLYRNPSILIHNLTTSTLSLPPLASVIPWDNGGDAARLVRETMLAGGEIKISQFSLPEFLINETPENISGLISKAMAKIHISEIKIKPNPKLPYIELITGTAIINKRTLEISDLQGIIGPVTLPTIKIKASGLGKNLRLEGNLKGPIKVAGTNNVAIEKFLMSKGFKNLTGLAEINMGFTYNHQYPDKWTSEGSLILDHVNAESYPDSILLKNLQGKLFFKRNNTTELVVDNISAKINNSPINLSGKLTGGRTPHSNITGKVYAKELDLAELNSLLPHFERFGLKGKVNMDLDISVYPEEIGNTRLLGIISTRQFAMNLVDQDTVLKNGDMELEFLGDRAQLHQMNITANNQLISIKGSSTGIKKPDIKLDIQSPDLNFDQLLSQPGIEKKAEINPVSETLSQKKELPSWAHNIKTELRINIKKGIYRNEKFHDLSINSIYDKGVISSCDIHLLTAGGEVRTTGSADLRDPERISFSLFPQIIDMQLESFYKFLRMDNHPFYGPLSLNGNLKGETGSEKHLLSSLNGHLSLDVNKGIIPQTGRAGRLLTRILTFINIKGLLSSFSEKNHKNKGLPFESLHSQVSFDNGNLNLNEFQLKSDSINADSQGVINLLEEVMTFKLILEPLGTLDKVLGFIPVLGKGAQKLTKIYLTIDGPMDNPEIRQTLTKNITDMFKDTNP